MNGELGTDLSLSPGGIGCGDKWWGRIYPAIQRRDESRPLIAQSSFKDQSFCLALGCTKSWPRNSTDSGRLCSCTCQQREAVTSSRMNAHGVRQTSRIGCPRRGIKSVSSGIGAMGHPAGCLGTTNGPGCPARGREGGQPEGRRVARPISVQPRIVQFLSAVSSRPMGRFRDAGG